MEKEITPEVLSLAQRIWDYHHMHHQIQKSECILFLGSHDTRVAERAAEISLPGWSTLLIVSGGLGRITQQLWSEPEAELFARIAN